MRRCLMRGPYAKEYGGFSLNCHQPSKYIMIKKESRAKEGLKDKINFPLVLLVCGTMFTSCENSTPVIHQVNEAQIQAALDTLPPYRWGEVTSRKWLYYKHRSQQNPVQFQFYEDAFTTTFNIDTDVYKGSWIDLRTFVTPIDSMVISKDWIEFYVKDEEGDWNYECRFYSQRFKNNNW